MIANKKGMAGIVTTLIIVALALVAVGMVWYVIKNVLSQSKTEVNQSTSDLFATCPSNKITTETGTCGENEVKKIVGGEYCCVAS